MLLFTTFFLFLDFVQPYLLLGYEILDLQKNDADSFIEEASAWTISQFQDSKRPFRYNKCAQTFMLGGPGVLGSYFFSNAKYGQSGRYYERVYNDLPEHKAIVFSLRFWAIGDWDEDDYIEFHIDNKVDSWYLKQYSNLESVACKDNQEDILRHKIEGIIRHRSNSVKLRFVSQINKPSQERSFGFRDLHLRFLVDDSDQFEMYFMMSFNSTGILKDTMNPTTAMLKTYSRDWSLSFYRKICSEIYGCFRDLSGQYFDGETVKDCLSGCGACSGPNEFDCKECKVDMF